MSKERGLPPSQTAAISQPAVLPPREVHVSEEEAPAPSTPAQQNASHTTQEEQLLTPQTTLREPPQTSASGSPLQPQPQPSLSQATPILIQMSSHSLHHPPLHSRLRFRSRPLQRFHLH